MVAGRAHEAENVFAIARGTHRIKRSGGGCAGELTDVFVKRRVGVEVLRNLQAREHFRSVRAENLFVTDFRWYSPG